jgi:hypothetical protein
MMDFAYVGGILVFLLVTCAMVVGCDKLGEKQ